MMRSKRLKFALASLSLTFAACGSALASGAGLAAASSHHSGGGGSSGGGGVWIQTMDSCKQALGGAAYVVSGSGASITVTTPSGPGGSVAAAAGCPLQQGNCTGAAHGCVSFTAPAPGTYTIRTTVTPPPNATNPEGYAPCEGGSACRSEEATLIVGSGGSVSATVAAVYPDGSTVTWPSTGSYSGSASNPIVFHDFGLAAPGSAHNAQCDGDGDADDHLTGSPSGHCAYPEAQETSACQPFPWSCTLSGGTPGTGGHHGHGSGGSGGSSKGGHSTTGSSGGTVPASTSGGGSRHNGSARSFRTH
jgi:hypothetical protein